MHAMRLHVLTADEAGLGRCLDGSPPAYYHAPAAPAAKTSWLIMLKGGGWCTDRYACHFRSRKHGEGSTHGLASTYSQGGILSSSQRINPTFAAWHRVFVWYCDGGSFTGDRAAPLVVGNRSLWFRGRAVLDAIISHLMRRGLAEASQVLLAGHSAGGLAATVRADSVVAQLPPRAVVKVLSVGGFFLQTADATPWARALRSTYELHGARGGVAPACLAAHGGGAEGWRCLLANATALILASHPSPSPSPSPSLSLALTPPQPGAHHGDAALPAQLGLGLVAARQPVAVNPNPRAAALPLARTRTLA